VGGTVCQEDLLGGGDLLPTGEGSGIIEGDDKICPSRRPQTLLNDGPGFEPIGEGNHTKVMPHRCPHLSRQGLEGTHAGTNGDLYPCPYPIDDFQQAVAMPKMPQSPPDTTTTDRPWCANLG
jgi:hypothetical protein